jgi:hypothetical protein
MVNITFGEERTVLLLIPHYWWGDILLVRETWSVFHDDTGYDYLYYKADEGNPDKPKCFMPWKPSISMPRIVSRLFLEVKNVRIERLRNITAIDAFKEGFMNDPLYCPCFLASGDCPFPYDCPVCGFRQTWDSMNAKCGYPWESNPWVWVYEFMRLA